MADINGVIAAYESQMQRAFHQDSRGIATPEQRAAWRREVVAAIDAVADRAWHEGYVAACEHYARASDVEWDYKPEDPEDPYRHDARAVLALIPPQRCAPSKAELSAVLIGCLSRDDYLSDTVRAVTKLYADQPTVTQAKAEAVREAVKAIRGAWDDSWNLRDPEDPETAYSVDVWLSKYADRIERGE